MSSVLAIETSTDACSIALEVAGRVHVDHRVEPRAHARLLLPMIDALLGAHGLAPRGLDAIAFGQGPGSFTGLRIAAAVTQALAWAHELPVLPCSSLAVLAATARAGLAPETPAAGVVTLVDARMGELYWNAFRAGPDGLVPLGPDRLAAPAAIAQELAALPAGPWLLAGDGLAFEDALALGDLEVSGRMPAVLPEARYLLGDAAARLAAGAGRDATQAVPVYLRDERRWRRLDDPLPAVPGRDDR